MPEQTKPVSKPPSLPPSSTPKPPPGDPTKIIDTPTSPQRKSAKPSQPSSGLQFGAPINDKITQETHDKIVEHLKGLGVNVSGTIPSLPSLGKGDMGIAFDLGDKVLKVTTDESEAQSSFVVKNLNPPSNIFTKYDDIFGFQTESNKVIYGLLQEKLEKADPDWARFSSLWYHWRNREVQRLQDEGRWNENITPDEFRSAEQVFEAPITEENVLEFTKWLQSNPMPNRPVDVQRERPKLEWLMRAAEDLKRAQITYRDLKANNLMRRGQEHVLIDLGASRTGQQAKIPTIARTMDSIAQRIYARSLGWPRLL